MFDADGALKLAGSAGGALEDRFLRVVLAEQWFRGSGTEIVEIAAQTEHNFFGVEELAGVGGGAVFGAAATLHAGIRLQRGKLREVGAGNEAEVFVAGEGWNAAEAAAREEDSDRAQNEMQMLGMRNDGQKDKQRDRVRPPEPTCGGVGIRDEEGREIRCHEGEDE